MWAGAAAEYLEEILRIGIKIFYCCLIGRTPFLLARPQAIYPLKPKPCLLNPPAILAHCLTVGQKIYMLASAGPQSSPRPVADRPALWTNTLRCSVASGDATPPVG